MKDWITLCTKESACCPEFRHAEDGGIELRDGQTVIKLTEEQWERIQQERRLRNLDRDSNSNNSHG